MREKVGLVTIGQSPRNDVVGEIADILGIGIEIMQKGALDGLTRNEIEGLRPEKKDFPLITRLRNGTSAIVGKEKIIFLLQKRIVELEESGLSIIGLLCTDEFPELESRGLLLMPSKILFHAAASVLKKGKIGVFCPLPEQKKEVREKWGKTGLRVVVEALNPYQETSKADKAIERMKCENVDLIVLDCIGYSFSIKEKIAEATGKPVLLPRTVLARFIKDLM
jgi:protein AroM